MGRDDDDERKRKKDKHEHKDKREHKDKHKDKDKRRHDKEHKEHKEHKRHKRDRDDEKPPPDTSACAPCAEPISEDDYFAKSREFQLWLQEARSTFLDEISSEEAHRLFKKFVAKWNAGSLSAQFYSAAAAQPAASRTRHKWAFANKLSDNDQYQLDRTINGVGNQTNLNAKGQAVGASKPAASAAPGPARAPSVPSAPPSTQGPPRLTAPPAPRAAAGSSWDPEAFKRSMGM